MFALRWDMRSHRSLQTCIAAFWKTRPRAAAQTDVMLFGVAKAVEK